MKTLPEATESLLAAARQVANAASDVLEAQPGTEDWGPLEGALAAFADADIAHAEARDRDVKAQALGETLSARLANVLGDADVLAEFTLESKAPELLLKAAATLKENVRAVFHSTPKADPTLEDKLHAAVSKWLKRVAPALAAHDASGAELKLRVSCAHGDEDGTLVLEWTYDEGLDGPFYDEDQNGRVPGVIWRTR